MSRIAIPLAVAMVTACTWPASAATREPEQATERGSLKSKRKSWHETVLDEAARKGRYTFFFFHRKESKNSKKMAAVIKRAKRSLKRRADFFAVDLADSGRSGAVERFKVRGEPVTVAVAPGGVVTAYIQGPVSLEELERALVSPGMAKVLGAVQAQRVVFLCVQGEESEGAAESLAAARQLEESLEGIAEVVVVDPSDKEEGDLLRRCSVPTDGNLARVAVIGPKGVVAHRLAGKVTEDDLLAAFQKMLSGGGGCGAETATGGSTCSPQKGATGKSGCE